MKIEEIKQTILEIQEMVDTGDPEAAHIEENRLLWKVVEEVSKGDKQSQSLALATMELQLIAHTKWYV